MEQTKTAARPGFLTVLCILTFVGSGLGLIGAILGMIGSNILAAFSTSLGNLGMLGSIISLTSSALCLVGAILMWGLKKNGFLLYLIGAALGIIFSIYNTYQATSVLGAIGDEAGMFTGAAWTGTIIGAGISIAFILMYNANRKHLVN